MLSEVTLRFVTAGGAEMAVFEEWSGPVPRVGEYLCTPAGTDNVLAVKAVTWRLFDGNRTLARPVVEVTV